MFNFEIWHIPNRKYYVIDGFSRKTLAIANWVEAKAKTDINNFILIILNNFQVLLIFLEKSTLILANIYSNNLLKIVIYLITLYQPSKMTTK